MAIRFGLMPLALLALAHPLPSFAQVPLTQQSRPQIVAPAPEPSPQGGGVLELPQKFRHLTADAELSRMATEDLHNHLLPDVDAQVLSDAAGKARSVVLTGQVRSKFGKQYAERKVRDSLGDPNVIIKNQIEVDIVVAPKEIAQTCQGGMQRVVVICPTCSFTDTGLRLHAGDKVSVRASGIIDVGPPTPMQYRRATPAGSPIAVFRLLFASDPRPFVVPDAPIWSLIGRVGETGEAFEVGDALTFHATKSGRLYLGVNDNFLPDNTGSWVARIGVCPVGRATEVAW